MTVNMSKVNILPTAPTEKEPPQFEDFLKPNPFIRSWMLKFLPENRRLQDLVFVLVGCILFFLIAVLLHENNLNDFVSAGISIVGIGILVGEAEARHIIAGIKFGQAKTQFKNKNLINV